MTVLHCHGIGEEHKPASVISGDVPASLQHAALDDTVTVHRKQLHALRQDQLARGRWAGTLLPITSQDLGTLVHDMFSNLLGRAVQCLSQSCGENTDNALRSNLSMRVKRG